MSFQILLMISLLRISITVAILLLSCMVYAQDSTINESSKEPLKYVPVSNGFAFEAFIQRGDPVGNNFAGNGLNGGLGYGLRFQVYVHRGFYLGGALSNDRMTVKDVNIAGNFQKAVKRNSYLYLGYERRLNNNFSISGDLGIGYSVNANEQERNVQGNGSFTDSGGLLRITTSVSYELTDWLYVFISPSFETVDYKIRSAPQLGDQFDTANYLNLNLGVRLKSSW